MLPVIYIEQRAYAVENPVSLGYKRSYFVNISSHSLKTTAETKQIQRK